MFVDEISIRSPISSSSSWILNPSPGEHRRQFPLTPRMAPPRHSSLGWAAGCEGTKEMKTTPFWERVGRFFLLGEALCDMVQKEQLCRGPGKPMFIEETCLELHRVILGCFEYWTYLGSNTTEPGSNQQVFGDLRWISKVVSIAL